MPTSPFVPTLALSPVDDASEVAEELPVLEEADAVAVAEALPTGKFHAQPVGASAADETTKLARPSPSAAVAATGKAEKAPVFTPVAEACRAMSNGGAPCCREADSSSSSVGVVDRLNRKIGLSSAWSPSDDLTPGRFCEVDRSPDEEEDASFPCATPPSAAATATVSEAAAAMVVSRSEAQRAEVRWRLRGRLLVV